MRSRIRQYVLLEGLALVIALLGALFWGSFLIDWCYFALSRLELPRWFRATVLVAGIGSLAFGLVAWVALRLLRSLRAKALALVLERRFPELDDRLITAVEAADGRPPEGSPVSAAIERICRCDFPALSVTIVGVLASANFAGRNCPGPTPVIGCSCTARNPVSSSWIRSPLPCVVNEVAKRSRIAGVNQTIDVPIAQKQAATIAARRGASDARTSVTPAAAVIATAAMRAYGNIQTASAAIPATANHEPLDPGLLREAIAIAAITPSAVTWANLSR